MPFADNGNYVNNTLWGTKMVKKIDIQGCIEGITDELVNKRIRIGGNGKRPLIIMENAPVSSTALDIGNWNQFEWMSIKALIAWAAANNGVQEEIVRIRLAVSFAVEAVEDIRQECYDDVIKFLVDFQANMLN